MLVLLSKSRPSESAPVSLTTQKSISIPSLMSDSIRLMSDTPFPLYIPKSGDSEALSPARREQFLVYVTGSYRTFDIEAVLSTVSVAATPISPVAPALYPSSDEWPCKDINTGQNAYSA